MPLSTEAIIAIVCLAFMFVLAVPIGHGLRKHYARNQNKGSSAVPLGGDASKTSAIPGEIIAVITAAIQMTMAEKNVQHYAIRSIRRVPAWNSAARNEQQKRLV